MKKYNKIFKNRQILTSEEMNDIVDVINDIIGQVNETNADNKYFSLWSSQEVIKANQTTSVTIGVKALEGSGDIRNIKIYWDRDGFNQALNEYAITSINVSLDATTTFKATLAVAEANNLITKTLTIFAVSPTYIGSGRTETDVVMESGELTSRAQSFNFRDRVEGKVQVNIYKGENLYFFVPSGIKFDIDEIYLDSIVFPLVALDARQINGIDYKVYKSSGGDFEDTLNISGFAEDMDIELEIF